MACCVPPSTRTEPTSTLTFRFRAAVRDPVISCAQFPPSRNTRVCGCCAVASGMSMISSITILESLFNSSPSLIHFAVSRKQVTEISQSQAIEPTLGAPVSGCTDSDRSEPASAAPRARCCPRLPAQADAVPEYEGRRWSRSSVTLGRHHAPAHHSLHTGPTLRELSGAHLDWRHNASHTSRPHEREYRRASGLTDPPNPYARRSCNCSARRTIAIAGYAGHSAILALPAWKRFGTCC